MTNIGPCTFPEIAARSSCHWEPCDCEACYQAVDAMAPIFERRQRPVCARHARFLATQGYWIFPGDPESEAENLRPEEIGGDA
jgi:hypothetical protein